MAWIGRDFRDHPVLPNAMGRAASHQLRLPRAPSNLVFNTSRDGAPIASVISLCQGLTTL